MKNVEIKEKKFKVERVVYYNSQKLWGALGLTPVDSLGGLEAELLNIYGSISACGSFPKPYEGAEVIISGEVIVNPQYGKQISVKTLNIAADTSSKEGIINYLAKGEIEGIGVQLAEKIYETFGDDAIDIVTNQTDRLLEIYGIGKKTVQKVKDSLTFLKTHEPTIKYLTKIGVSYRTIMQLIDEFGDDTVAIIQANPYEILDVSKELTFRQVDDIYLKAGGDPTSSLRLKTGFLYLLKQQAMMEGSTGCLRNSLSKKFYSLMDIAGSEDFFGMTMEKLEEDDSVILHAYEDIADYTVTDCSAAVLSRLAKDFEGYTLGEMYSIKGENREGEIYMEFYPDEEALDALILELFYAPKN